MLAKLIHSAIILEETITEGTFTDCDGLFHVLASFKHPLLLFMDYIRDGPTAVIFHIVT